MNSSGPLASILEEAVEYFDGLKLPGRALHGSPKETGVLGFTASCKCHWILSGFVSTGHMKYLATYQLSQDNIELTFNVI
jgi:hypothetical protein